ncbi:MAG: hypothetical protein ACYCP0_04295 [Acidiferrobacteraceae bacterium]
MPRFFDLDDLTPEQRARWDVAVARYNAVMDQLRASGVRHVLPQPGHEKSALFARLLNGLEPLPHPPPLCYSYPWYEVIEGPGPWRVIDLLINVADKVAVIDQDTWRLVESCGHGVWIVQHSVWPPMRLVTDTVDPGTGRLRGRLERLPAAVSSAAKP